ncbi:MAG: hypothetical protein ACI9J2_002779 [Saprospiraceae bacterium]|jgi:hypothetical protein
MFKLPDYEVTVHIIENKFSNGIKDKIDQLSKKYTLRQSIEYQGVRDYHWAFSLWDDAVLAGEKFKAIIDNPNCILLEVNANYDDSIEPIIHKRS